MNPTSISVPLKTSLAWYKAEEWNKWKAISVDRSTMCDSHADWLCRAEEIVARCTKDRMEVHKVVIGVDECLKWAQQNGRIVDSSARTDFARHKFEKLWAASEVDPPLTPTPDERKKLMKAAQGMDLSELFEPFLRRPKASVCPIFVDSSRGTLQVGSGVLLKVGDTHLLLSAAHVTDERKLHTLLIPSRDGFINPFGLYVETPMPASGNRLDDRDDVVCIRLDPKVSANLNEEFVALEAGECNPFDVAEPQDVYTIIGYPASKSGSDNARVFSEQFSFSGDGVMDWRLERMGLDPKRHILVQHRAKKSTNFSTMTRKQPPHPAGMSGGGIFAWSKELPKRSAMAQPRLVAILTEYHQTHNVYVGTRIGFHLSAIHSRDPSLPIYSRKQATSRGSE